MADYRKLKVEGLILMGYSHDDVAGILTGKDRIKSGTANRMMTDNGWAPLRNSDRRAARLVEIGNLAPHLRKFVDEWALKGQRKAVTDLEGPMPHARRVEATRRLMLVKEIARIRAMPPEANQSEREMGLVVVRRETLVRVGESELERAFPDENKANCQLVLMAHKGLITDQEAIVGIKYRNDFHRIGGTIRSSGDLRDRVSGGGAGGHTPAGLAAMDQRRKCVAAVRYAYPTEADMLLSVLDRIAVQNMSFREMLMLAETAPKAVTASLKKALEPVGWAYNDMLATALAAKLTSWWKSRPALEELEP